jgi:hypothetical protein
VWLNNVKALNPVPLAGVFVAIGRNRIRIFEGCSARPKGYIIVSEGEWRSIICRRYPPNLDPADYDAGMGHSGDAADRFIGEQ